MVPNNYGVLQFYSNDKFGKLKGEISLADGPVTIRFLDIQKTGRPYCFEIVKGFYQVENKLRLGSMTHMVDILSLLCTQKFVCQAKDEQDCKAWVSNLLQLVPSNANASVSNAPVTRLDTALGRTGTVYRESMYAVFNQTLNSEIKAILVRLHG